MAMNLCPALYLKVEDKNGRPLAGGLVYTYIAGSLDPAPTYSDASGVDSNTNPVVLNSAGIADIWIDPALAYKFVINAADGTPFKTIDNVTSPSAEPGGIVDSIQAGANVSVDSSDPANPIVSAEPGGIVDSIQAGANVSVDSSDPANPIVSAEPGGIVDSIQAGANVSVDSSDPANPIVSAEPGGIVDSIQAGPNVSVDSSDPANPIVSAEPGGIVDSIQAGPNIIVDDTNPENPIVGVVGLGVVNSIVAGDNITVDDSDPANPIVSVVGLGIVDSIQAGANVSVDSSDPANPIVSAEPGGIVDSIQAGDNIFVDDTFDPANPIVSVVGLGVVDSIQAGANVSVDSSDPANPIVSANTPASLDDLSDVTLTDLTDGDILQYDSVSEKWKNISLGNEPDSFSVGRFNVTQFNRLMLDDGTLEWYGPEINTTFPEEYLPGSNWDNTDKKYVAPADGRYFFSAYGTIVDLAGSEPETAVEIGIIHQRASLLHYRHGVVVNPDKADYERTLWSTSLVLDLQEGDKVFIASHNETNLWSTWRFSGFKLSGASTGLAGGGTVDSIVAGDNITVDDSDPANPIVSVSGMDGESWAAWAANATITSDIFTNFDQNYISSSFDLVTGEYTFLKSGRFYVFGGFTWENNAVVGDKSFNTYLRHFRDGVQISAPAIVSTTYNGTETRRRQIEISNIFEVQSGDKVFLEVDDTHAIIKGQVRFGGMLLSSISSASGGGGGGNNTTMDVTSMTGTAAFSGGGEIFHTRFIAKNNQSVNAMEIYLENVAGGSSLQLGIYDQSFNKIGESTITTPVNGFNRVAISNTILTAGDRYYASAFGNNNMQVGYKAGAVMAGNGYREDGTSLPATINAANQANIFIWLELLTI